MLDRCKRPVVSRLAARTGRVAFFAPLMEIDPVKGRPPRTNILSIGHLLQESGVKGKFLAG